MRGKCTLLFVLLTAIPSVAFADIDITFDFDDLDFGDSNADISAYMTDLFNDSIAGGTVTVSGAGTGGDNIGLDLGTAIFGTSMGIQFNQEIIGVGFDGFILSAFDTNPDFRAFSLDQNGNDIAQIFTQNFGFGGAATWFNVPLFGLGSGVYGLRFSDTFVYDVAIDNLVIRTASPTPGPAVPAPGAAALALMGLGLTDWAKRRAS